MRTMIESKYNKLWKLSLKAELFYIMHKARLYKAVKTIKKSPEEQPRGFQA